MATECEQIMSGLELLQITASQKREKTSGETVVRLFNRWMEKEGELHFKLDQSLSFHCVTAMRSYISRKGPSGYRVCCSMGFAATPYLWCRFEIACVQTDWMGLKFQLAFSLPPIHCNLQLPVMQLFVFFISFFF